MCQISRMPTDGADFKRRVKYHGKTYTEIKNGSDAATIALYATAGLARELLGDNPIVGYHGMIQIATQSLTGIFSSHRSSLLQDITGQLGIICDAASSSSAQKILVESIVREVGEISNKKLQLSNDEIRGRLFAATGRDLFEGLVIANIDQYAMHHRNLSFTELNDFITSVRKSSADRLTSMMKSAYENGKIDRQYIQPIVSFPPLRADSYEDLNSPLVS